MGVEYDNHGPNQEVYANLIFFHSNKSWVPNPNWKVPLLQTSTSPYNCVGHQFLFPMEYAHIHVTVGEHIFFCHFMVFVGLVSTWKYANTLYYFSGGRIKKKCEGKYNQVIVVVWSPLDGTLSDTNINLANM